MFSSLEVTEAVNIRLEGGRSISRTSIIYFLQGMSEKGILVRETSTGKGGYRGLYQSRYDELGLKEYISKAAIEKLLDKFPEGTMSAIKELI